MSKFKTRKIRPLKAAGRGWRETAVFWVAGLAFFFLLPAAAIFGYQKFYEDKIYPGVTAGSFKLGGMTRDEALSSLKQFGDRVDRDGIAFEAEGHGGNFQKSKVGTASFSLGDPDLSRTIITFDFSETVDEAMRIGRQGSITDKVKSQWQSLTNGQKINLRFRLDGQEMERALRGEFADLEEPAIDARMSFNGDSIEIAPEKIGYGFDYPQAVRDAENILRELSGGSVSLLPVEIYPRIRKADTAEAVQTAHAIRDLAPLVVQYGDGKQITLEKETLEQWLEFQVVDSAQVNDRLNASGQITVGFNRARAEELLQSLARETDREPEDARFQMKDGKVVEFGPGLAGLRLDIEEAYVMLNREIISQKSRQVILKSQPVSPKITVKDINDLGINVLIGTGKSDFSGSPANRRHNIKVGADALNGILIAPDEEFSTIKTLGEISGKTGYLPELVIKGNRTVPEYGGGLCQIGTTVFRVALDAGLPITERQAHSYRVVYYEPAGTDATIYNPHPDLKFTNDTGHYILLTTKMDGNELTFELWGTSDGRKVELIEPKITNIVKPGPPKYIETEDLEPGQKKKIESAHNGADAQFSRTVTYADGRVAEKTWQSHYVPWQEVWLIGKAPAAENGEQEAKSSSGY